MSSEKLERTSYRDPTLPNDPPRLTDLVNRVIESARDMDDYNLPLGRIHGSGLHGWGIASGLSVTATLGSPGLNVLPGVAIDRAGQHISLALNGEAEIGPNASDPGAAPNLTGVPPMGAVMPTNGLSGILYLTIQFWEWFQGFIDPATDPNEFYKYIHTPWLRLQSVAPTDGSAIVLAQVTLDASGHVTALSRAPGLGAFLPAESIHLSKAVNKPGPNFSVDSGPSGEISSHPDGGIRLKGQNASDEVHFVRSDGSESITISAGNGYLAVGAPGVPGTIGVSDWTTRSVVLSGDQATISVGRASNYGEVDVYDSNGHLAVASDGALALITVGGTNNPGVIRTFDAGRNTTVRIEAATGVARLKRLAAIDTRSNAIDVDALFFQIHGWDLRLDGRSGGNKRALVDWNNKLIVNYSGDYGQGVEVQSDLAIDGILSAQGIPLMGNPARKVSAFCWMFTLGGGRPTAEVDLGRSRQFTAFGSFVLINSTTDFDYDNEVTVEVYAIDGTVTSPWIYEVGGGPKLGPFGDDHNVHAPIVSGVGRIITFRIQGLGPDVNFAAIGIVFYE